MQDLVKQEQFELEVLDRLNSKKMLNNLIFTGGTMLRLCFGLDRFSVDLDFWLKKNIDTGKFFVALRDYLTEFYTLNDSADKFNTLLFELKSKAYPRSLKIEIRKEVKKIQTENAIAFSKYSNSQVFLNVPTLQEIMKAKIETFLSRKEIRDVFDIEFLLKKGINLDISAGVLKEFLKNIESFTEKDYTVKLGSLLEQKEREYYCRANFKILKLAVNDKINAAK